MRVGIVAAREGAEMYSALVRAAGMEPLAWSGAGVPEGVRAVDQLAGEVDVLLIALPADQIRRTVRALGPGPADRVVLAGRGFEPRTGLRLSEVVESETACLRVGVLAGPILPGEVRRGSPSAGVCASRFDEVAETTARALHSSLCRVYPSPDLVGVELSGALVEVVQAALGTARGLGLGVGTQALVVSRGIAEGSRLASHSGGDPRTFAGLAGAGELIACLGVPDHGGLHRGLALARGETDLPLAALCARLLELEPDLPITAGLLRVARGEIRAVDALNGLLARGTREEFTG